MDLDLTKEFQKVIDGLTENFSEKVLNVYQSTGDTFVLVNPTAIVEICTYLKEEQNFIYLADVFGADNFTAENRFEVIYNMASLKDQIRLFVKVQLEENEPTVASVTGVWKSANWYEREVYDMFGITFTDHPDMRRIYMPEDYEYFPCAKSFLFLVFRAPLNCQIQPLTSNRYESRYYK
ncbi:MAG: NADH-quinone oxidoreductase subunit C [Balneolaceae bacterium]|nr:NADH-quinone oxidoreductase subunit C [Balneolaceae bacterium]